MMKLYKGIWHTFFPIELAYKTGETARACLFIVGFVLILLKDISSSLLTSLISFAALQTILMQILGFYFR